MTATTKVNLGPLGVVNSVVEEADLDQDPIEFEGTSLTEQRDEELGEGIAQRLGGRPFLAPENRPSLRLAFRVPPSIGEELDAVAKRTGRRVSDVLRETGAAPRSEREYLSR